LALITLVAGLPGKVRAADDPKEPGDRKPQGEAPAKPQGMTPEGILGLLATGQDGRRTAKWLEDAFEGQPKTEAAEMLIAIARGSQMGPGEGWFHPGQGRYNWEWLAARHGIDPDGAIPRDKFRGPEAIFLNLDRNRDGELRADDFEWSDRSAHAQQ